MYKKRSVEVKCICYGPRTKKKEKKYGHVMNGGRRDVVGRCCKTYGFR